MEDWTKRETVIAFCKGLSPEVREDYPFHDDNWTVMRHWQNKKAFALYYRVVVIRAPLQGLCYTVRDAVDWLGSPTTRWFQKGSNHSPLQFC